MRKLVNQRNFAPVLLKVQEAQELAEIKTRAEMRLGELTAAMPKVQGIRTDLTSAAMAQKLETKQEA